MTSELKPAIMRVYFEVKMFNVLLLKCGLLQRLYDVRILFNQGIWFLMIHVSYFGQCTNTNVYWFPWERQHLQHKVWSLIFFNSKRAVLLDMWIKRWFFWFEWFDWKCSEFVVLFDIFRYSLLWAALNVIVDF